MDHALASSAGVGIGRGASRAQYLATPEGRALVETMIMQMQSGAYS